MTQLTTPPNPASLLTPEDAPLRSVFIASLAEIFAQLTLSLVVSTDQACKVILVRYAPGAPIAGQSAIGTMNTHFRALSVVGD
jgi:hypothetical protein